MSKYAVSHHHKSTAENAAFNLRVSRFWKDSLCVFADKPPKLHYTSPHDVIGALNYLVATQCTVPCLVSHWPVCFWVTA